MGRKEVLEKVVQPRGPPATHVPEPKRCGVDKEMLPRIGLEGGRCSDASEGTLDVRPTVAIAALLVRVILDLHSDL